MWNSLRDLFGGGKPRITSLKVFHEEQLYKATFSYEESVNATVGALVTKLSQQFNIPQERVVLYQLEPRRKLTNPTAYLSDYGLVTGASILVTDSQKLKKPQPKKPEPATPKEQIQAAVKAVDEELGIKRINAFIEKPPKDPAQREQEWRILTEVILQNIIKLDNVEVAEDAELRLERKQAINKFHIYHKDIDVAYNRGEEEVKVGNATNATNATNEPKRPKKAKKKGKRK